MTDICWFCKKNTADPTKTIEVPLYNVISQQSEDLKDFFDGKKGTRTTYTYLPAMVLIPRCGRCEEAHVKVGKFRLGRILVKIVSVILGLILIPLIIGALWGSEKVRAVSVLLWLLAPFIGGLVGYVVLNIKTKNYPRSLGIISDEWVEREKYPEVSRLLGLGYKIGKKPT